MIQQIDPGARAGAPEKIKGLELMQKAVPYISVGRIANLTGVVLVVLRVNRENPVGYNIVHTLVTCFPLVCSIAQVWCVLYSMHGWLLLLCYTKQSSTTKTFHSTNIFTTRLLPMYIYMETTYNTVFYSTLCFHIFTYCRFGLWRR